MAKELTPIVNPAIPTTLTVPIPGDGVQAAVLEGIFQNLLNGLWAVKALAEQQGADANTILSRLRSVDGANSLLDADLLDGLTSADFWRKTDQLPAGSTDAQTLQGNAASAFLGLHAKADNAGHADGADYATNAGTAGNANALGGHPAGDFDFSRRLTYVAWQQQGDSSYPQAPTKALGQHAAAGWALLGQQGQYGGFTISHNMGATPLAVAPAVTGNLVYNITVLNGGISVGLNIVRGDGTSNAGGGFNAVIEQARPGILAFIVIDLS